jgi:16S rRNA (cytidine1402-2'-O)-methyltransferase
MKKLYILPNRIHEDSSWSCTTPHIEALIAESDKGGWQYLKAFGLSKVPIYLLNEHNDSLAHIEKLMNIPQEKVGLISDAGLPCLADPGSLLIAKAQEKGVFVETLAGPSSIIMALQLCGFSGQSFFFLGYFPKEEKEILSKIRSLPYKTPLMFIETPYRTKKIFEFLRDNLPVEDNLCVALELMGPSQFVQTLPISQWRKQKLPMEKGRGVFILYRNR